MTRTALCGAVLACIVLGAAPLVAAADRAGEPAAGALPALDLTIRDDAVAGLPGVLPAGPMAVRVGNAASTRRSLVIARLDGGALRVAARTGALAPGDGIAITVRFVPGRWLAAQRGVSRGPAAATLVPGPTPGAPR